MKNSEKKKKLVEELVNLHRTLNVHQLYTESSHKITLDWLAETASVLKNLDENDYQEFSRLRKSIYPGVLPKTRKDAAHEIDGFVRQKVAEYKRYDFSSLDENKEKRQKSGPIGILNNGRNNVFNDNKFINLDVGIQDNGENTIAIGNKFTTLDRENKLEFWYQKWWGLIVIGVLIIIVGVLLTNTFGLTKP